MSDLNPPFTPCTMPIRLGYVGCGFMAQNAHLPNFSSLPGCQLAALAESGYVQRISAERGGKLAALTSYA